jgi:hypothetical protein
MDKYFHGFGVVLAYAPVLCMIINRGLGIAMGIVVYGGVGLWLLLTSA